MTEDGDDNGAYLLPTFLPQSPFQAEAKRSPAAIYCKMVVDVAMCSQRLQLHQAICECFVSSSYN